jgi:hypothetical protein
MIEPTIFDQVLSTVGALLVLGAYVLNLMGRLDRDGAAYAAMNLVGSGILGYVALRSAALGLILIEFAWAFVSLLALARALFGRRE